MGEGNLNTGLDLTSLSTQLVAIDSQQIVDVPRVHVPGLIADAGEEATKRFFEFFAATIGNRNTRHAYARAIAQFLIWCEARGIRRLRDIEPIHVAAYLEMHPGSAPTVKQYLAAIRKLFDWLVTGQVLRLNPAHAVRGPRYVVDRGKTPVLSADQAKHLLGSISLIRGNGEPDVAGLRDRALIAVMVYSFARVSAAVNMRVEDYYQDGKRWWFRLHEKRGKLHMVPVHHKAEEYLDEYLAAVPQIASDKRSAIFRSIESSRAITANQMTRNDALRMIKRRAKVAGLPESTCCHTFRATGITTFLQNDGTIESAQAIAAHASPRTTKLYDRTSDAITLDEVERILL